MRARKNIYRLLTLAILGVVVLAAALIFPRLKERWSAPLGPGLELPTYTPDGLSTLAGAVLDTQAPPILPATQVAGAPGVGGGPGLGVTPGLPETPSPSLTPTPEPLCGGPPVMYLLGIGADSGLDYNYGLADVIRVARVDFTTPKVTMLSMPRDLWVEIPEIAENYDITHGKLNQAYFYGGPGMGYYDGPGAGPGLLARTLDLNFGLRADHYGAVNMQTFAKIVDAVGGIDLYLPTDVDGRPIDDKTEDMGYFYAGQNHFNGSQALRFARIRKKYNDFTRMDHQNMVICALKDKITSPAVLPKIPQIIAAFQGQVLTDLSPEQIGQFACLAPHLKRENLIFSSLPDEILTPGRVYSPQQKAETFIMEADFNVIRDYVQQFIAGTWPSQPDEPTCP